MNRDISAILPPGGWYLQQSCLKSLLAGHRLAAAPVRMDQLGAGGAAQPGRPYAVVGGVAVIPLTGLLLKAADPMLNALGVSYTSTSDAARAFQMAQADPSVTATLIYVDSPGGQVAGTGTLADLVFAATKPTVAFVSDLSASAAYYVAAQADQVVASPAAWIGSIGCFSVVYDQSAAAAAAGVTVNVVKSGPYKGAFTPGTAVTADQLAQQQRVVDTMAGQFIAAVSAGRGMGRDIVSGLASGQVWSAPDAKSMGLIDGVGTLADAIRSASTLAASRLSAAPAGAPTSATATGPVDPERAWATNAGGVRSQFSKKEHYLALCRHQQRQATRTAQR